jgi:uncharacterized membrane protein
VLQITQFIAALTCGLFAGAAIYISFVEHPARMSRSTEIAATVWAPSYKRATLMQAPLAVISSLAGFSAWFISGGVWWLVGALVIFSVVPFTLLIINGTNKQLLLSGRDLASPETRFLLERWGRLHAVRTVLSTIAAVIFLAQLIWA